MKIRSRVLLLAVSFVASAGGGVAIAGGGQACLNECNAYYMACLQGSGPHGKGICKAQLGACKASCGA